MNMVERWFSALTTKKLQRSAHRSVKELATDSDQHFYLVGEGGLEPPRPFGHRNLNPARLPIPPLARATSTR